MTIETIPTQITVKPESTRKLVVPNVGSKLFHEQRPVSPLGASVCSTDVYEKEHPNVRRELRRRISHKEIGGRGRGRMARRSSTSDIPSNFVALTKSNNNELTSNSGHSPRSGDENEDNECSLYDLGKAPIRRPSSTRLSSSTTDMALIQEQPGKETGPPKKPQIDRHHHGSEKLTDPTHFESSDRRGRRESLQRPMSTPRQNIREKTSGGRSANASLSPIRPVTDNSTTNNHECSLYDLDHSEERPQEKAPVELQTNSTTDKRHRRHGVRRSGSMPDMNEASKGTDLSQVTQQGDHPRRRQSISNKTGSTADVKNFQRRPSLSPVREDSDKPHRPVCKTSIEGKKTQIGQMENQPTQELNAERPNRRSSLPSTARYSLSAMGKYDDSHNPKKTEGLAIDPKSRMSADLLKLAEARRDRKTKKKSGLKSTSTSNLRTLRF